jgi:uncharacterized membrane protein
MKRRLLFFFMLCAVLLLNVIFTQYLVHQFFYENYINVLIFCGLNLLLFPAALMIYRKDRKIESVKTNE